jgi:hypothetical protein
MKLSMGKHCLKIPGVPVMGITSAGKTLSTIFDIVALMMERNLPILSTNVLKSR